MTLQHSAAWSPTAVGDQAAECREDNATVMNKSIIQWVAVPTALSGEPFISTPCPEQSVSRALLTLSEIVTTYISSRHHQQAPTDARLGSPAPRLVRRRRESSTADERAATRRLIPKRIMDGVKKVVWQRKRHACGARQVLRGTQGGGGGAQMSLSSGRLPLRVRAEQ